MYITYVYSNYIYIYIIYTYYIHVSRKLFGDKYFYYIFLIKLMFDVY